MKIAQGVSRQTDDFLLVYMPNSGKDILARVPFTHHPDQVCIVPWDLKTPQAHLWREAAISWSQKVCANEVTPTRAYAELLQTAARLNPAINPSPIQWDMGPDFLQIKRTLTCNPSGSGGITPDPFLLPHKIIKLLDLVCDEIGEDFAGFGGASSDPLALSPQRDLSRSRFRKYFKEVWHMRYSSLRKNISHMDIRMNNGSHGYQNTVAVSFEYGEVMWDQAEPEIIHKPPHSFMQIIRIPAHVFHKVFECD